ncbi:MAG: membrane protein insertion efficiency factor YidD [Clostridia bacterium]|nr:membrane protein insertion efficiency factor YidD [Clostridia bacterium]
MKVTRFFRRLFVLPIRFYQKVISPALPSGCRFFPTCSQYAIEAIEKRGVFVGLYLAGRRLLKCNPWGGFGYDPVPERTRKKIAPAENAAGQQE